jgi:hypothetical protein
MHVPCWSYWSFLCKSFMPAAPFLGVLPIPPELVRQHLATTGLTAGLTAGWLAGWLVKKRWIKHGFFRVSISFSLEDAHFAQLFLPS